MLLATFRLSRMFVVNCVTYIKKSKGSSCNMTTYSWTSLVHDWTHFRRMIELLTHPPYSPDLDPLDYYLFRFVKCQTRGQDSVTNQVTQEVVHCCLQTAETELCPKHNFKLLEQCKMHESGWCFCRRVNIVHRFD